LIFDSKKFIPQVYAKERDIQVFTKLIDIILTNCKYDIDNLGDLYDAYKCPQSLLPLLAYTLNYKYNFSDTVTGNRRTIDAFALMERNRGSEIGLKMIPCFLSYILIHMLKIKTVAEL
jgi:phage tail-like protein